MADPTKGAGAELGKEDPGRQPEGRGRRPARWPLVAALAWTGVAGAAGVIALRWGWRDALGPASGALLAAHYAAFLACTFAYHAGLAMLPVAAFALWARRRRLLATSLVLTLLGAGPSLLTLLPRAQPEPTPGTTLTIMSANLLYGHAGADALLAQVERERPDVLVLQEWTPRASAALGPALRRTLPHAVESPGEDAFGQAVFSRTPFLAEPRVYPPAAGVSTPQITAEVALEGRALRVTDIHLMSPVGPRAYAVQRREAAGVAAWVGRGPGPGVPDVLIGDFNGVPEAPPLRALRAAGLRNAHTEAGRWRGSTWPRTDWLGHFPGVGLDHALLGPRVECVESRTLEDNGSDHRPIVVRVRWTKPDR